MAGVTASNQGDDTRPLPLRANSEPDALQAAWNAADYHARSRSTYVPSGSLRNQRIQRKFHGIRGANNISQAAVTSPLSALHESFEKPDASSFPDSLLGTGVTTPPLTPVRAETDQIEQPDMMPADVFTYDFSRIDYELERAKAIGKGLWSSVYLAQPVVKPSPIPDEDALTPPSTPERKPTLPPCSLFAVKTPLRPDSNDVFLQEARMLTVLQSQAHAQQYIVPFYGFDARDSSLIFEAAIGGSLDHLVSRLKQMTEVARHLEIVSIFPGIAKDLVSGLEFMHDAGVIHADIKPGNILLDISEHYSLPRPVIRARYIDFSAAFLSGCPETAANAGGTWDYMAPEQMRIQRDLNTPTFASDVWSLAITLLATIVGGSPYTAACGDNLFMLREAIKTGDPLGFARTDRVVQKRMAACQDFIDGLRLALQKDRERRTTATAWKGWFESLE